MSQRQRIRMSDEEIAEFLEPPRKMHMASLNADGTPHLVTMYYAMADERITFWTYGKSQKAVNLERDPRITCLVEDGDAYEELRGVQVAGRVEIIRDYDRILEIGSQVYARYFDLPLDDGVFSYVEQQARKRLGYVVKPERVVSWDHRKL